MLNTDESGVAAAGVSFRSYIMLLATWPEIWPESSMIPLPQEKTSNSKDSRNNWSAFSCCWLNL
jgi:hypothetical protein